MPPLLLNDLALINLVYRPEMPVLLIQEYRLEDMILVGYRRLIRTVVNSKLMLIVRNIKCHLNLVHVFRVGMRIVHRTESRGFVTRSRSLVLGKSYHVLLLLRLRFSAKLGVKMRFEILLEVLAVGVGDSDIVEECCTTEYELLLPSGDFAEKLFGVVGEYAENHVIECFCCAGWAGVFATTKLVDTFLALGIKGARLQYNTILRTGEDGGDVSVSADFDSLRAEVGGPVAVERLEVRERDHKREVRKEGIRIVVPEFHVGVIEEAFKDGAGDVGSLITLRMSVRRSQLAPRKEGTCQCLERVR